MAHVGGRKGPRDPLNVNPGRGRGRAGKNSFSPGLRLDGRVRVGELCVRYGCAWIERAGRWACVDCARSKGMSYKVRNVNFQIGVSW